MTSPETHAPWAGKEQPRLQTPVLLTARDEKDSLSEVIKAPYNSATCKQAAPRPHTAPRNTRSHLLQRGRAPAWLWQMSPRRELWMEHHVLRKEPLVVTLLCPELTLRVPLLPQTSRPSRARPGHCQPLGSAQSRAGADPKELAGIRDKCRALNPTARALSVARRRTTPRQAEHPTVLTGLPMPCTPPSTATRAAASLSAGTQRCSRSSDYSSGKAKQRAFHQRFCFSEKENTLQYAQV